MLFNLNTNNIQFQIQSYSTSKSQRLFTIYMGKPVSSRFGKMVLRKQKFRTGKFYFAAVFYNLHKLVPFTEKRPQKPETGIKDRISLLDVPLIPEFSTEKTGKAVFHLLFNN